MSKDFGNSRAEPTLSMLNGLSDLTEWKEKGEYELNGIKRKRGQSKVKT